MSVWIALGLGALFLASLWWADLTRKRREDKGDGGDSGYSAGDGDGDCGGDGGCGD